MEPLTGIIIRKSDMKMEGKNYIFFAQVIDMRTKAGLPSKVDYQPALLDKYEELVVTDKDEIKGKNGEDIDHIPVVYQLAQQLFTSG